MTASGLEHTGLLLEGGGMRGVYTAGVLDFWMERNLYFPYIVGISSGSWIAASYMAKQRGRSRRCMIDYSRDPRAISYRNWLLKGSLFGMDFLFGELAKRIEPFDYDAYFRSDQQLIFVLTDAHSGEAVYYSSKDAAEEESFTRLLTASISLPLVSRIVEWDGRCFFDGGVADSLPLLKAQDDGYRNNVLVLNKAKGYRKTKTALDVLAASVHRKHPALAQAILNRYLKYNRMMEQIERLEEKGELFVIRPSRHMRAGRGERRPERLEELYEMGYADAASCHAALVNWLETTKRV